MDKEPAQVCHVCKGPKPLHPLVLCGWLASDGELVNGCGAEPMLCSACAQLPNEELNRHGNRWLVEHRCDAKAVR